MFGDPNPLVMLHDTTHPRHSLGIVPVDSPRHTTDTRVAQPARHARRFLVDEGERTVVVPAEEIEWIGSAANYVELHVRGASYLLRDTMASLERRLDPGQFLRIHRRVIVNIAAIGAVDRGAGAWEVVLRNGTRQPVARSRQAFLMSWLAVEATG